MSGPTRGEFITGALCAHFPDRQERERVAEGIRQHLAEHADARQVETLHETLRQGLARLCDGLDDQFRAEGIDPERADVTDTFAGGVLDVVDSVRGFLDSPIHSETRSESALARVLAEISDWPAADFWHRDAILRAVRGEAL